MTIQDLYDVSWRHIRLLSFSQIHHFGQLKDKDQAEPRHLVHGTSVLLLLLCKYFNLEVREVLTAADRVLRRAESVEPLYPRAINTYLEAEIGES